MEQLTDGPLVLILGWYCDSPMTALAFACTCKDALRALESAWPGLCQVWARKWGDRTSHSSSTLAPGRSSKRLRDREYYSGRRQFVRLVETGALHAAQVHAEIFTLSSEKKPLTVWKLRDLLNEWTPVWVNCGGFGRELGATSVLVEALRSRSVSVRHARAITEELVLNWGADVNATYGDGMRPLCVAAARGFPQAVEFLLTRNCAPERKSALGTFMVKKRAIKGRFNAHEWAVAMYQAELASGTKEIALKNLKQCIALTTMPALKGSVVINS